MTTPSREEITKLLIDWSNGDQTAFEKLAPLVYEELHRLAKRYMGRERPGHILQTTALINEVYLRLVDEKSVQWRNRAHFFGVSARLMRCILVDFARARHKGGKPHQISLDEALLVSQDRAADFVALDDALTALAKLNERHSRVVELRFFGGLSIKETAAVLNVSPSTVKNDWGLAKAWLLRELSKD